MNTSIRAIGTPQELERSVSRSVVSDYILYTIIQAFAVSTPSWRTTEWIVFAAYNVGLVSFIALGTRSILKGDKE
jgi:hypothetical protein